MYYTFNLFTSTSIVNIHKSWDSHGPGQAINLSSALEASNGIANYTTATMITFVRSLLTI